jgi:hypothetical protein
MVENDPFSIAVCDAGPLIHLDELESLSLLSDFHQTLPAPRNHRTIRKTVQIIRSAVVLIFPLLSVIQYPASSIIP